MFKRVSILAILVAATIAVKAQTIEPIISEYSAKAEGKISLRNNSLQPMVVLLQPKGFSLNEEGKGSVHPLDAGIHVHLSSTSLKLAPGQTGYVFYDATADMLPAWFTIYATFTAPRHGDSLDLRIVLPHTVYLYQKEPLHLSDVAVKNIHYDVSTKKVDMDVQNMSGGLGRVQGVHVSGEKDSADATSFPLLPGAVRHLEVSWNGRSAPQEVSLRFEHFKLSAPVTQ